MVTDNNPYYIMDASVQHHIAEVLNLAQVMADKSYPHLSESIRFKVNLFREKLLAFNGSQNVPSSAKKAF